MALKANTKKARENGDDYMRSLELPDETRAKLRELQDLSKEAEAGNREARKELRRVLRTASPEIVARCSDFARRGQRIVAETMAAGEPLMEEALVARLDHMREQIAGPDPSPLELLLTERIVSTWLIVETLEALMNAQLKRGKGAPRTPPSYLKFIIGWLDSAHRRHLSSIRELARVRKLQINIPGIQVNTQINVSPSTESSPGAYEDCL